MRSYMCVRYRKLKKNKKSFFNLRLSPKLRIDQNSQSPCKRTIEGKIHCYIFRKGAECQCVFHCGFDIGKNPSRSPCRYLEIDIPSFLLLIELHQGPVLSSRKIPSASQAKKNDCQMCIFCAKRGLLLEITNLATPPLLFVQRSNVNPLFLRPNHACKSGAKKEGGETD